MWWAYLLFALVALGVVYTLNVERSKVKEGCSSCPKKHSAGLE